MSVIEAHALVVSIPHCTTTGTMLNNHYLVCLCTSLFNCLVRSYGSSMNSTGDTLKMMSLITQFLCFFNRLKTQLWIHQDIQWHSRRADAAPTLAVMDVDILTQLGNAILLRRTAPWQPRSLETDHDIGCHACDAYLIVAVHCSHSPLLLFASNWVYIHPMPVTHLVYIENDSNFEIKLAMDMPTVLWWNINFH